MRTWPACKDCPLGPDVTLNRKFQMVDPYMYSIFNPDFVEGVLNDGIQYDNPSGFVYFITDWQYVKIGQTTNLQDRINTLQVGNARKLKLLFVIPCLNKEEATKIEYQLHRWYRRYQMNGEWFDILDKMDRRLWEAYFSPDEYMGDKNDNGNQVQQP